MYICKYEKLRKTSRFDATCTSMHCFFFSITSIIRKSKSKSNQFSAFSLSKTLYDTLDSGHNDVESSDESESEDRSKFNSTPR